LPAPRHGEIYQAKWYNSGDDPQTQVQYSWQSPWKLLGPVLPGDHAPAFPKLPRGTHRYHAWLITAQYTMGSKVLYQGLPYVAKWSNQGVFPQTAQTDPSGSPWQALYQVPGEPGSSAGPTPTPTHT
jgi:chitinase